MSKGRKTKEIEIINAIDYIKNSTIFGNPRYKWIIPLITKTLDNDSDDNDIDDLIDSFLSKKKIKSRQANSSKLAPQTEAEDEDEDSDVDIKKIKNY